MKKINLGLAIFAAAIMAVNAQTNSYSDVVGYYTKSFPAGGSLQTVALLKPVTFQGAASSIVGAVLNATSPGWTVDQFNPANSLPAYYVEITSGPRAGYLYDIISNTASSLTVSSADIANAGGTASFLIRAHTNLSEALKSSNNLTDYGDQITVFNGDDSSGNFIRDSSTSTGWLDATTFSESDAVIYPSQGYVLTATSSGDYMITGTLKSTPTVVPLYAGQVNIVSLSNPGGITKDIQNIDLGVNLIDYSDQVATYLNDGSLGTQSALLYGGGQDGFLDATTFSPVTGVNVAGEEAVIVSVSSSTTWSVKAPLNQ